MYRILMIVVALGFAAILAAEAKAQCANGNCSSQNATLGESVSSLPAPVFAAPQPAPQIAYFTAPGGASASSAASTSVAPAPSGQLYVAGYTAPPQPAPQMAFFTVPVNQSGGGSSASASAGSASTAASTSTSPSLIGASTNLACQNGGCGGRRFAPFQNLRARRSGNFAKSVSISRS